MTEAKSRSRLPAAAVVAAVAAGVVLAAAPQVAAVAQRPVLPRQVHPQRVRPQPVHPPAGAGGGGQGGRGGRGGGGGTFVYTATITGSEMSVTRTPDAAPGAQAGGAAPAAQPQTFTLKKG